MTALRLVAAPTEDGHRDPDLGAYLTWAAELRGLRPNTIRVRGDVLGRIPDQTGKQLRDLTEADLLLWERNFLTGRAPETRRAYLSHMRAWFAWAVKTKLVDQDPTPCLTQPKLMRGLPRPVCEADLRLAVEKARPKMRLMILLGAFCGLRCQEIAGLHWSDLHTTSEGTVLLVREGKGGKERVVPVPGVVIEAMVAHGRRRSGPMFYGMDAAQMDAKSVSRSLNRFFQRNGLAFTAHQLRHRYATTGYQLTKDIRLMQEMLGHSSPQTTARYTAFDKSGVADMVERMDAAWQRSIEESLR
ncbi:MAG: tyrosine-type recombinase/integrase [Actinomycetota bacterium]|nr:tyrosine-type recombinase/integrase [Actinomycetota bacterium]